MVIAQLFFMGYRLLLILLLVAVPLEATPWRYIGPGSLGIRQIVPDRRHSNVWFVTVVNEKYRDSSGLFRSTDAGLSWHATSLTRDVIRVMVHPKTSAVLVVTHSKDRPDVGHLWVSTDAGASFQSIAILGYWETIVLGEEWNVFYLFNSSLAQISRDSGKHWENVGSLPAEYGGCKAQWVFNDLLPFEGTLYASASAYRSRCPGKASQLDLLLASPNQGKTWTIITSFPRRNSCPSCPESPPVFQYDPVYPTRTFLCGNAGIWSLSSQGLVQLTDLGAWRVTSIPHHPATLVALHQISGVSFGVWRSTDSGATWTEDSDNLNSSINEIQALDGSEYGLLAGTAAGVYRRIESFGWKPASTGLKPGKYSTLYGGIAGTAAQLYAVDENRFVYRRGGPEQTWRNLSDRYILGTDAFIESIHVSPRDPNRVALLREDGAASLLVSQDGGNTWRNSVAPWDTMDCHRAPTQFDTKDPNVIFIWCAPTIMKSGDGGRTFQVLPVTIPDSALYRGQILVDEHNNQIVYFVSELDIFKSTDGGQSVRALPPILPRGYNGKMAALPDPDGFLMVNSVGAVFQTTNGGESWQKISHVNLNPYDTCDHIYSCEPSQAWAVNSRDFIVLGHQGLLFESKDAGIHWSILNRKPYGVWALDDITNMTDPRKTPFFISTPFGVFRYVPDSDKPEAE